MEPGTLLSTIAKRPAAHLQWDGYLAATKGRTKLLIVCEAKVYLRETDISGDGKRLCVTQKLKLMSSYLDDILQQKWASNAAARLQQDDLSRYLNYELKCVTGAPAWEEEALQAADELGIAVLTWDDPPFKMRNSIFVL